MGDSYIRLRRTGPQLFGASEGPDPLLFVDVDDAADVESLREVPHTFVASARTIVFRTSADAEDVQELMRRLDVSAAAGVLKQSVGEQPDVHWVSLAAEGEKKKRKKAKAKHKRKGIKADTSLLDRARRVELRALLDWGGAIWKAGKHHYLLPSGLHANAFVKAGHAIGEPRDAEVLASWLLDRFDSEMSTSMVVDSGTLSAVALALKAHRDVRLGDVAILERYPATDVDVERLLDSISRSGRVAALISVCSSGSLRDRLRNVLGHFAPRVAWSIDSLVDLKPGQAERGQIRSWVVLPRDDQAIVVESQSGNCKLCRDHDRAILVPIDPHTFDAYIPTLQERKMPDVQDGDRNQFLWETCTQNLALEVESRPDQHVQAVRRSGEVLSIKIDLSRLISKEFAREAAKRFEKLASEVPDLAQTDLVLLTEADEQRPGFELLWNAIIAVSKNAQKRIIPADAWSTDLQKAVQEARHTLVFSIGSVTGTSMQRALASIQRSRQGLGTDYRFTGVVVHARPEFIRDWTTLVNSFGGFRKGEKRLFYLWRTFLPSHSPLQDESELLERVTMDDASDAARTFHSVRRAICSGRVPRPDALFWGANSAMRLSSHSRFGHALDQIATYAAVASALQSRRQDEITLPHRLSFELPAMFRSFYDPLIVCSLLRWVTPSEAWWGRDPSSGEEVSFDLLQRAKDDPPAQAMIAAELLIASALGKLPPNAAKNAVEERARRLLDNYPDWGFLEVALRLPRERIPT